MISKEKPRSNAKGERTMRKLFESAALLFSNHEFDDVTVDAIVEAAGVSKGTFYIYFESKDALIAAFLSDYVSKVDAEYKSHLDSHPDGTTASELILSLTAKIVDMITIKIGYNRMKTVYKVMLTDTIDMDTIKGYNRHLYQLFASVLERGMERGEFHTPFSIDILARQFVMAIRGLCYEWCIRYPKFDLEEQAFTHIQIMLNGIKEKRAAP